MLTDIETIEQYVLHSTESKHIIGALNRIKTALAELSTTPNSASHAIAPVVALVKDFVADKKWHRKELDTYPLLSFVEWLHRREQHQA